MAKAQVQPRNVAETEVAVNRQLQLANVAIEIPASLNFLPILCAALREYCVALPLLLESAENSLDTVRPSEASAARLRFGTGPLQLPGSRGSIIRVSYSHLVYSLELALQEAATNIVRHGYMGNNLAERIRLHLSLRPVLDVHQKERRALIIELFDTGMTFDIANAPYNLPDPDQLSESGYGLYLIHKLTDQLGYFQQLGQNCLQMIKFL